MDRFSLILMSIPVEASEELLSELSGLGWSIEVSLPIVLISGIGDSEARIRRTDLELLGAELEIIPVDSTDKFIREKKSTKDIDTGALHKEETPLEIISVEVTQTPTEFQLAPADEPTLVDSQTPLWELDDDAALAPSISTIQPGKETKNDEISQFSFNLEDEVKVPSIADVKETPTSNSLEPPPSPKKEHLSLLFEQSVAPSVPESMEILKSRVDGSSVMESEEVAVKEQSSLSPGIVDATQDLSAGEDESEEEWLEIEEDGEGEHETHRKPLQKKKVAFIGALLATILILIGYTYLFPEQAPIDVTNDGSSLVDSLLNQQERIARDERQSALKAIRKRPETPSEIIKGSFPLQLSNNQINGEIRFGRYQSGLLIESFKLIEEKQQRLSPQEMVEGKTPRPWIKNFQIELPPIGAREQLGATYRIISEARLYIEDSAGTIRVPSMLELDCEFKSGASLNCLYNIRNKALYKKRPGSTSDIESGSSMGANDSALASIKPQLTLEREPTLGFLVIISGSFQTKLNPM